MVKYSSAPPPQKKLLSKTLPEGSQILAKYESLQARSQLALFPIIIGCVGVVILLLYTLVITMLFNCVAVYRSWLTLTFMALKVYSLKGRIAGYHLTLDTS